MGEMSIGRLVVHNMPLFFIGSLPLDFLDCKSSSSDSFQLTFISMFSSFSSWPMLGVCSVCERCSAYCNCDAGSIVVGCWCCGKVYESLSATLNSTQELDLGSGRQEQRGHVVVEVDVLVGSTGCCQCSTGRSDFATTLMVLALSLNLCLSVNKVVMKGIHISHTFLIFS